MYAIRARRKERGLSIAVALLVLLVVAVIGLAIAAVGTQNLTLANSDRNQQMAKYGAEAAVAEAAYLLKQSPDMHAGESNVLIVAPKALQTSTTVSYRAYLTSNYGGSADLVASDGTHVPVGHAYLLGQAIVGRSRIGAERYPQAEHNVGGMYLVATGPIFKYAAFGVDGVDLQGTSGYTDSWNSADGTYDETHSDDYSDLGTNSTADDAIDYTGGATNYGDAWVCPGGDPSDVIDGHGYTGTAQVLPTRVSSSPQSPPAGMSAGTETSVKVGSATTTTLTPGRFNNFDTGSKTTVVFTAGTYYFTGVTDFGAQNTIEMPATGTVKIYISGTWDSQGGTIVNPQAKPSTLQIFGTSTCTSIDVNGGNDAYYVVHAPKADVTVQGNSAVYGALIGKTVKVAGNAQIHYDRDLLNMDLGVTGVVLKGWRR